MHLEEGVDFYPEGQNRRAGLILDDAKLLILRDAIRKLFHVKQFVARQITYRETIRSAALLPDRGGTPSWRAIRRKLGQ
jgi:hypothetical protein